MRSGPSAGTGRADELAVMVHEPGRFVLARWRNVLLFYWQVQGTPHAVELLEQGLMALSSDFGGGLSTVHLIKEGAGLPDAEVRKGLMKVMGDHAEVVACIAVVMMGAGFWASALQSVITGLRMLAPPRSSLLRFAREPLELKVWLPHEHLVRTGQRIDEARFMSVMAELISIGDSAPRSATATATAI